MDRRTPADSINGRSARRYRSCRKPHGALRCCCRARFAARPRLFVCDKSGLNDVGQIPLNLYLRNPLKKRHSRIASFIISTAPGKSLWQPVRIYPRGIGFCHNGERGMPDSVQERRKCIAHFKLASGW
ncbi:hypothetical protein N0A02_16830 [Paraburkholderia acidicola]|uniref:Uncharacterized protein n=1 Tax=Paraburkholderia acidicola TaxID=1912599 RepID=A0ABV1LPM0_9BURK